MLWLSKEVLGIHRNSVKGRLIYQICYGCKRIQKFEVIGSGGGVEGERANGCSP